VRPEQDPSKLLNVPSFVVGGVHISVAPRCIGGIGQRVGNCDDQRARDKLWIAAILAATTTLHAARLQRFGLCVFVLWGARFRFRDDLVQQVDRDLSDGVHLVLKEGFHLVHVHDCAAFCFCMTFAS
jgi:hypothetical protein